MSCFCLLCSALSHMRWGTTHFNVGLRPGDFFFIFYFFSALNPVRSPMCRQAGEKQRWAGPPSPSWLPVISLCFHLCLNTVSLSSHLTTRSEPRHHLQNLSESSHTLQTQKLLVFKPIRSLLCAVLLPLLHYFPLKGLQGQDLGSCS